MPGDEMPRRVRPPDKPDGSSSAAHYPAGVPDELMSQFDAIERLLQARREEAERDEEIARREARSDAPSARGGSADEPLPRFYGEARVVSPAAPHEADAAEESDAEQAGGRRRTVLTVVIVCAIAAALLAGVGAALVLSQSTTPSAAPATTTRSPTPPPTGASPMSDQVRAAQWVAAHVGPNHTIACDTNLCTLARSAGLPATSLVTVGSDITQVERAEVVISTALIRGEFGAQLTAVTSPEPLASFGTGDGRVDVTAVAVDGSADYAQRLAADRTARGQVGTAVANNPHLTAPGRSIAQLNGGYVDSRLCSLLTLISTTHTITVGAFSGAGPGAGTDIPETDVLISRIDGRPAGGPSPQAATLLTLVNAQQAPYRPMTATRTTDGLEISFSQPAPFGLTAGATP